MNFETNFEFNDQEFILKIYNDKSHVFIQIICIEKAVLWSLAVTIEGMTTKFNFLEGCFSQPDDLAEYLIYQVNSQEFKLESGDEEGKILNMIFWIQREKDDEIEQYDFYFSLQEEPLEFEKNEQEKPQEIPREDSEIEKKSKKNLIIFLFLQKNFIAFYLYFYS